MHEFSVVRELVGEVMNAIDGKGVESVNAVELDIGELTFLAERQMKFAFESCITGTVIEGAELKITSIPAEVKCESCQYTGPPPRLEGEELLHTRLPLLACPECEGKVDILAGRECILRNISAQVREA